MNISTLLKKIPLLFGAVALAVSGVAAVSAYESHIVNVQAHVENAMTVPSDAIDLVALLRTASLLRRVDP